METQPSNQEVKVLYLGMALDIMSPLLLVPDLSTLYVMDIFNRYCHGKTFEAQMEEIRDILRNGNDTNSWYREVRLKSWKTPNEEDSIHYLKTKSEIVRDEFDGKIWRLDFIYDGILRKLVLFHDFDFEEIWPSEITNIRYVLGMGSVSTDDMRRKVKEMLAERTTSLWKLYLLYFNHKHFPTKIIIKCGKEREGTEIAMTEVKNTGDISWFDQVVRIRLANV